MTLDVASFEDSVARAEAAERCGDHPALMARIFTDTEGNPLFVVETVRADVVAAGRAEQGQTAPDLKPGDKPASPPTAQAVIAGRLARLSRDARHLAGLAATIGRAFTVAVLAEAYDGDEDTLVRALDELWRRRIIREQATHGTAALGEWGQFPIGHASCCFQWTALWPLIGVALTSGDVSDAIGHARALLAPWQQRAPDELADSVSAAVAAWERRRRDEARMHLARAMEVAMRTGYL